MKKGERDMTKGEILPQILIFALPLIAGQLFQQLYRKTAVKLRTFQGGGCKAEKMNASIVINRYECYNKSWTDR